MPSVNSHIDTLNKPDMRAILKRTPIKKDINGFLLPIFEAISNAIYATKEVFLKDFVSKGLIDIHIKNLNDIKKISITIKDNGIGLNEVNYSSFKTPFSGYRLKDKARGFGRFVGFQVFSEIKYCSEYLESEKTLSRCFKFDIFQEREFIPLDSFDKFEKTGLCLNYAALQPEWNHITITLTKDIVIDYIAQHFLSYFLSNQLPRILIQFDDAEKINITETFQKQFSFFDKGQFECVVDGQSEVICYQLAKIPHSKLYKNHCALFSAGNRIVGQSLSLESLIGVSYFTSEQDEKYIVASVISADLFENRLNDTRTAINISYEDTKNILKNIVSVISEKERSHIEKIRSGLVDKVKDVLKETPTLRSGLSGKTIEEFLEGKPNNFTIEKIVSTLSVDKVRNAKNLSQQIAYISSNPEEYIKNIKDVVGKIDNQNKEALAEYITHRKKVIKLLEIAQKYTGEDKKYPLEDQVHDLIFRRFHDKMDIEYFQHNLWLVDDLLSFLPYISSDRTFHGSRRKKGDKVADLVFFDDSLILGDDNGSTIIIVEFKKPSRDDYRWGDSKHDPVSQIIDTIYKAIDGGQIKKTDGTYCSLRNVVRRFGYIIADLTQSLIRVLQKHDFKNTWNKDIYVLYRDNEEIFIQVMGYNTLIENAKKRNDAFFKVLFDE